jgi:hypothetical protein
LLQNSLLNLEEVWALKNAVLWQVSAVDSVHHSVAAEAGAQGIWTQVLCDLRVHWSAQCSERINGILLTDFHHDAGTAGHLFSVGDEFWQHASVNFKEFASCGFIHVEHLHCRNLKSLLENCVNNFAGLSSGNYVRLNHNAGAVVEDSGRGDVGVKENVHISTFGRSVLWDMNGVLNGIGAKLSLDLFSAWLQACTCVLGDNLNSSAHITQHVLTSLSWLAVVLLKEASSSRWCESAHLQIAEHESVPAQMINNFAGLSVGIGLEQYEWWLLILGEHAAGKSITIVNYLKLSWVDSNDATKEELVHGNFRARHSLQEHLARFEIELQI